jgi:antitoxin (DNA-binding transcriptional repressor) of toxin-antitoxin stability system
MNAKIVDVSEAAQQLSELLSLALDGNEVIIAKDGQPLVKLVKVPSPSQKPRVLGLNRGEMWMSEDFDEPMNDDFFTVFK